MKGAKKPFLLCKKEKPGMPLHFCNPERQKEMGDDSSVLKENVLYIQELYIQSISHSSM